MKKFKNIKEFYAENVKDRERSGEVDFGIWWKSKHSAPVYPHRISWIRNTGEFYVINLQTDAVYLADKICETEEKAEKFMKGWANKCGLGTGHTLQEYFPEITQ